MEHHVVKKLNRNFIMATIRTVLGKIKVKETVSEIFDQNPDTYIRLTEVTTAEKMNGDIVKYENFIFVRRESIIIIEH